MHYCTIRWTLFTAAIHGGEEEGGGGGGKREIPADYPTLAEGSRDWAIITPKWSSVQPDRVNEAW